MKSGKNSPSRTEYIFHNGNHRISSGTLSLRNMYPDQGLFIITSNSPFEREVIYVSSLDETVKIGDYEYQLSSHRFNGYNHPEGESLISIAELKPHPKILYEFGSVEILKEILPVCGQDQILIKYTVLDAPRMLEMSFRPLLLFRSHSNFRHVCDNFSVSQRKIKKGREFTYSCRDFKLEKPCCLQFSRIVSYTIKPEWYYNAEYMNRNTRRYEYHEDLYSPGVFTSTIENGQSLIVSLATKEINPDILHSIFADNLVLSKKSHSILVN